MVAEAKAHIPMVRRRKGNQRRYKAFVKAKEGTAGQENLCQSDRDEKVLFDSHENRAVFCESQVIAAFRKDIGDTLAVLAENAMPHGGRKSLASLSFLRKIRWRRGRASP
jgi:hypothetical protein